MMSPVESRVVHEIDELRSYHGNGDPEIAHGAADAALLRIIDATIPDLAPVVREAFDAIEKWYA